MSVQRTAMLERNPSVICRLETYIGNKLDWKHLFRLGTKKVHWKQDFEIGNIILRLETKFLDWKHMFLNMIYLPWKSHWNPHLFHGRFSRTIVNGFLSQNGRSCVKVDGHLT